MKTRGRSETFAHLTLCLKSDLGWVFQGFSDFRGPPIFKIFFCTKGTTLLFFLFLVVLSPKSRREGPRSGIKIDFFGLKL